ncbi:MAG: hypothetical protein CMC05_03690 [Flavobacteriaceae bacterium]|nr:hypothetical protein [Flavobacteriaceae bacterium]|tara:strand:+ start:4921 stop:5112 length:192 start_codon:yes stop_codon:yes gene_type:complete
MKLLKIFQYAYIFFALLFLWDAYAKWSKDGNIPYMSLFLAALAIFMFFFRKRFANKFQDRNKD